MGFFKNIITFGASGRVEKKIKEYERYIEEYKLIYPKMEKRKKEINKVLKSLITVKIKSLKSLKKIEKISKNLKGKDRNFLNKEINTNSFNIHFKNIEETISLGEAAMNATKGITSGVSTAVGSWALVSSLGSASTGTALTTLSGAAATNATLAWFGGGSLAAGGGGIAAGTAALGGIIAIPALAITGIFNHLKANKKINEIESEIYEIRRTISRIKENILMMDVAEKRSHELIDSLNKTRKVFSKEVDKTYRRMYPIPFLSIFLKTIRKVVFKKNYFSQKDLKEISYIGGLGSDFAKMIDSKVF